MSGDQITVTLLIRSILTIFIHLLREQLLKSNSRSNNTLEIVINLNVNNNLTSRSLRRESLQTLTDNSVLTTLVSSLVTQLSLQGVFLARNQVSVGHSVLDNCTSRNLLGLATKLSLSLNARLTRSLVLLSRRSRRRLRNNISIRRRRRLVSLFRR